MQTIYAQEVESYEYKKEAETPYRIQLGFFNLEENARALQAQLLFLGYDAVIEPGEDGTYRVYSGSFEKLDNAAKMEQTLRKAGFPPISYSKGIRKNKNVNLYTFVS